MERPLSAVRTVARAGVQRRRLQTFSIGLVVLLSTTALVFGLSLLASANSLFDDAFERANGAHATASFDSGDVTADQAGATGRASGVTDAAGPFRTAVLSGARVSEGMPLGDDQFLVVGRADPGGPVDRLTVTSGRWARAPGEIVLRGEPNGPVRLGTTLTAPGLPPLDVVGFATSMADGTGGWVTPDQVGELRPSGLQMLYRFARAADSPQVQQSLAAATAGLSMRDNESYVTVKQRFEEEFNSLTPFITVFGVFALAVSVFIIGNVVGGAVASGFRHIGVMKALGFTPAQVTGVYVVMFTAPASAGCTLGILAGHLLTVRVGQGVADSFGLPSAGGGSLLLDAVAGGSVIALVMLSALVPALRAGRLPAVAAISAGTVSRRGSGRRVQRRLARTRLPVAVGLGLSLPVARPARTALTVAGLCLGVTAATMGLGLHQTVTKILTADTEGHTSVSVGIAPGAQQQTDLSEQEVLTLLRGRPGTAHIMSFAPMTGRSPGIPADLTAETYSGEYSRFLGDNLVRGRWFARAGEVVPAEGLMRLYHLDVGDTLDLRVGEEQTQLKIVGSFTHPDTDRLMLDAASLRSADGGLGQRPFSVIVTPGTDPAAYAAGLNEAASGTGLYAEVSEPDFGDSLVFSSLFLLFSLFICGVAALGVLNSVVLSSRERSRDLGVLKAIGMAPRQVVLMMVTSMAALGIIGGVLGVPLGVLIHHGVVELTGDMTGGGMAASFIDVYTWPLLVLPALAGVVIAVLGAWVPAVRAAATGTAAVLRSE
ncbi:ABC transporter permease [Streptomyces sp. NPDC055749]